MIKDNDLINVRNRNNGTTGYVLPENNVRRSFAPGEIKKIPMSELRSLQYAPGGNYILSNLLIIEDKSALDELNMKVEPEYFYTEEEIRDMLFNKSMDEFLDFLDFATKGAIEIAKEIAIKEEVPDTRKRKALSEKTGFNIDNAIKINEIMDAEPEEKAEGEDKKERRVPTEEKPSGRRAATPEVKVVSKTASPQYKVVNKKE